MAVEIYAPGRITAVELGWKLRDAGYDVGKIEELSTVLGVDVLEILAGWGPTLARVLGPPPKTAWWKKWFGRR